MLVCVRQVTVGMSSLHHRMDQLNDESVQLKGEIFKKRHKVVIVTWTIRHNTHYRFHIFRVPPPFFRVSPPKPCSMRWSNLLLVQTHQKICSQEEVKVYVVEQVCVYVCVHVHVYILGCWFGDPQSESRELKVWVEGASEFDLRAVDCQIRVRNLCRKLTELLFTEEQLKN